MTTGMSPPKAVHVITTLDMGGAQETAIAQCRGLAELGWDVVLVGGGDPCADEVIGKLHGEALRTVVLPSMRRSITPSDLWAVRDLRRLLLSERPLVVHTHSSKAGVL